LLSREAVITVRFVKSRTSDASWLEGLNDAQRAAVVHQVGPLLIVAGAGTGKTKTLACRVAHLISAGMPPERILLLTFTRRAAETMLDRAAKMAGIGDGGRMWGGTFHAVANRLLRTYGRAVDLTPDFTVMDESDAADLIHLIRTELGLGKGEKRFPKKATLAAIHSLMVNSQRPLREVLEAQFPWCVEEAARVREVLEGYGRRKKSQRLLDYDDLLLYFSALVSSSGMAEKVAGQFDQVLVDEYQDTNLLQAEILQGLCGARRNLTVVGDDAQSIYSFRAATIRNILDFPKQFPGTTVVTLEQNYRSTQPILAAANAVMKPAKERYTKELWSTRKSNEKPVLCTCRDEAEQTESVCAAVLDYRERGIPLMRQAVLFRTGHHSAMLEIELSRRNIPFRKFGGLKFLEAGHIKDMLAFLRILENPHDEISWFRVLQFLDGVGPTSARRIMAQLGVQRGEDRALPAPTDEDSPMESPAANPLTMLLQSPPAVPTAAKGQLQELRQSLADCQGVRHSRKAASSTIDSGERAEPAVSVQIERLRKFYEPVFERLYDNASVRARDLEQLVQIALRYRSRRSFVTDLTLDPPHSTSDFSGPPHLDDDYLVLSTIHSAKGCEWDVVHVLHAADGNIPSDMAVRDEQGVEEERRLFYVALTRAKDRLYVYFPLRYYDRRFGASDGHTFAQLTRFLMRPARALFAEQIADGDDGLAPIRRLGADADPQSRVRRLMSDPRTESA